MLKDLIKLADNLDKSGLAKEANYDAVAQLGGFK